MISEKKLELYELTLIKLSEPWFKKFAGVFFIVIRKILRSDCG